MNKKGEQSQQNEQTEKKKNPPGYFESPWPDYPGYIQFKHPFLGEDYKNYIKAISKGVPKDVLPRFWEQEIMQRWRGAMAILVEWEIKDVPRSQMSETGFNMPFKLVTWTGNCVIQYLLPFVTGKLTSE